MEKTIIVLLKSIVLATITLCFMVGLGIFPHHFNLDRPVEVHTCCHILGDDFPAQYMGEFKFTHYAPTGNRTATQSIPRVGKTIAVDPKIIPLHSIVYIEDLGYFVAEDTGSAIKGNKIDIFVSSKEEAIRLGTLQGKTLKVWHMTQKGEENEVQKETSRN